MKKTIKTVLLLATVGAIVAGGAIFYMVKQPHRDVQNTTTDYTLSASVLVTEYLTNAVLANKKYLDEEGESKVLEISGIVAEVATDYSGKAEVLIKNLGDKAGVRCFFTQKGSAAALSLKIGDSAKFKGVIVSGAAYDDDLDMYEHAVMNKCEIIL